MEYKAPCRTPDDVLEAVKSDNIEFVQFWFTDVLGVLKSFTVTPSELEEGLTEGMGFDGSSIEGFARIEESDLVAKPDPTTFQILPTEPQSQREARMFCDIFSPDGTPYEGDPRFVLKRFLKVLSGRGYIAYMGPELEYFYFKGNDSTETLDDAGYFDSLNVDRGGSLRKDTIQALELMGIQAEYDHHEVAPSQHEIDLRYDEALRMADKVMTHRVVVKEVARRRGFTATFMPKPIFGVNGSGMHVHQSLFKGDKNAFYDPNDEQLLTDTAKRFIAGLLQNARGITLITNQWVNSYKRLVPDFEAPVYVSWARRNRSTLIRVPMYKPGKEKATRLEYRSPDPACNPYLAFAVMLAAGLQGVDSEYPLPDPIEEDIYKMSYAERVKREIIELPGSLYEAIVCAEENPLAREALGDHIFNKLIDNKRIEWDRYRTHVSQYEIDRYLPVL